MIFRAAAFGALLLLISGCAPERSSRRNDLTFWCSAAREKHLAGGSLAEFTRMQEMLAGDKLKHQLPDLIRLLPEMPPEKAAETAVGILNECVLAVSTVMLPPEVPLSHFSRRIYGRNLDRQSAEMLAEKSLLESTFFQSAAQYTRERELHSELAAHFGSIPPPGTSGLAAVQEIPVSPMPELTGKYFGSDPASLIRLGDLILALPGEFARQLAAAPESGINGIWLEARRLAALSALHIAEKELAAIVSKVKSQNTPENLYRFRRWFYLRENILSSIPLLRGSQRDIEDLESIIQLHKM